MSIEAMKQALEALKNIDGAMPFPVGKSAIKALEQAIAEAEKQEQDKPIGKIVDCEFFGNSIANFERHIPIGTLLYTRPQPRTWVGLTDEQILEWVESHPYYGYGNTEYREGLEEGAKWARNKFATHGIKE